MSWTAGLLAAVWGDPAALIGLIAVDGDAAQRGHTAAEDLEPQPSGSAKASDTEALNSLVKAPGPARRRRPGADGVVDHVHVPEVKPVAHGDLAGALVVLFVQIERLHVHQALALAGALDHKVGGDVQIADVSSEKPSWGTKVAVPRRVQAVAVPGAKS